MKFIERNLAWILITLGVVMFLGIIIQIITSLPPHKFTMVTGREGGGYYQAALAYQAIAKAKGFDLEIVPTAGSFDALSMLESGQADVGFVQGGVAGEGNPTILSSLANVFYEPVWIFYNKASFPDGELTHMYELKGRHVAVGEQGSGTRQLASVLLLDNEVTGENTTFESLSAADAAQQLIAGKIDAAFFVASAGSQIVQDLLHNPTTDLMNVDQAPAYVARHPYLSILTLPASTIDLVKGVPAEDKQLLATTANLVARNDFHPDLLRLVAVAAVQTHEDGGFFEKRFEFPNLEHTDLPINKEVLAYLDQLKNGDSFLDNNLPFWAAALINRYLLFVLPLVLIVLPILGRTPLVYQWYMRNKVNRWYKTVHAVELRIDAMPLEEIDQEIRNLDELDDMLSKELTVSDSYMPAAYDLRSHMKYVSERMEKRKARLEEAQNATPRSERPIKTEEAG